ncbi:fimbrial protein [Vibrio sp. FNV 38]|nr:fimbrial protein [Vibrio sp. FNV 38]
MFGKSSISLAIASVCLISGTVSAADYNETQVNFKGEIVSAACGLAPESIDQTIQLGQHPTHMFTATGDRSTPVSFGIKLVDCDASSSEGGIGRTASFTFHSNSHPGYGELFNVEGGASGVGVRILSNGLPINNGDVANDLPLVDGTNIMHFSAAYEATSDVVTAGTAESWALMRVTYQ